MQKCSSESRLTVEESNAQTCDTAKKENKGTFFFFLSASATGCESTTPTTACVCASHCANMCIHVCLCVCVFGHTERGARQQQLGRPSSVLLSSINDQSGPSGEREPPTTRTWHRTKDR